MSGTVDIDVAGILALTNEPESLAVLDQAANEIQTAAANITRRGRRSPHIADRYVTERAKATPDGGQAAVYNTSPVFHLEQFGSIHQAPGRMVERAINQTGYGLEVLPK